MVMGRSGAHPLTARPWRALRWLVIAPHPDDETLGTGALIAHMAKAGKFAGLVYLTDGSGSHPLKDGKAGSIVATRQREGRQALRRLAGLQLKAPLCLGWKDATPEVPGSVLFGRSYRKLAALCGRLRVDVLATTAPHEPHCDHIAAAGLAHAVRIRSRGRITVAEYCVWGEAPSSLTHKTLVTPSMSPGVRRYALAAHRSQLTASHGPGFRLPKNKRSMAPHDLLYVRKRP
jgi:LmbE family N-acetylglucosaminyl deacetylase